MGKRKCHVKFGRRDLGTCKPVYLTHVLGKLLVIKGEVSCHMDK